MAPELHLKTSYSAMNADLFALAVTLFLILSGSRPFVTAGSNDPYYKLFMKKPALFWKAHEKRFIEEENKNLFSEEFKSLMNAMLAFDSLKRPSIREIKSSLWYNGPAVSLRDLQQELKRLRDKIFRAENDVKDGLMEEVKINEVKVEKALDLIVVPEKQQIGEGCSLPFNNLEAIIPNQSSQNFEIIKTQTLKDEEKEVESTTV